MFTLNDRIYPIKCTYIRIEGILWLRRILQQVTVRQYGKEKNRAPLILMVIQCFQRTWDKRFPQNLTQS